MPRIYVIAGEASGDLLGGLLIHALKKRRPECVFAGVGGVHMAEAGITSLFDTHDISVMGFVEILPRLSRILRRIRETVKDIQRFRPDIVVTIDAPGFNRRIAEALQPARRSGAIKLVHMVAPSVWAYRPERAKRLAGLYDQLLCLLPFEPDYFSSEGLESVFIGHPVLESFRKGDAAAFRKRHGVADDQPVIALLPGSRKGEIARHMPVLAETVQLLLQKHPSAVFAMVQAPGLHLSFDGWEKPPLIIAPEEKQDLFAASTLAIAKSGTVTLELAGAQVPMVVMYRVNPISAHMMRKMIQVKYVTLVNLLLGKEAVPEYLQERCQATELTAAVEALLSSADARLEQQKQMKQALTMLMPKGNKPSGRAADAVLGLRGTALL